MPRKKTSELPRFLIPFSVIILLLMVALLLALFYGGVFQPSPARTARVPGSPAPEFSLTDANGAKFNLSAHRGEKLLLVFFGAGLPNCRAEAPFIIEGAKGKATVVFIGEANEGADVLYEFAKANGLKGLPLLDSDGILTEPYSVTALPLHVLVNEYGESVKRWAAPFKSAAEVSGWLG
jgi:peroxiredoxin